MKALKDCGFDTPPGALGTDEWQCLSDQVRLVLQKGHQALVDGGDGGNILPTVHGDARLPNVMARRDASSGFEVQFVDFGWSGFNGISRFELYSVSKLKALNLAGLNYSAFFLSAFLHAAASIPCCCPGTQL